MYIESMYLFYTSIKFMKHGLKLLQIKFIPDLIYRIENYFVNIIFK